MMARRQEAAARLCAAAATAVLTVSLLRRVRQRRKDKQEATALIAQLKALNSTAALVVTNAKGDAFASKALTKYVRKVCGAGTGDALEDATRLVEHCKSARPPSASAFGPAGDAKRLRHVLVRGCVSPQLLVERFPRIKGAYTQQALDYGKNSRYGDRWKISCYIVVFCVELKRRVGCAIEQASRRWRGGTRREILISTQVVLEKWKPKIMPHEPMVEALSDVVDMCCRRFEAWYLERFERSRRASVMNAFVTRYRPKPDEAELKKHIDGANVDGSVILCLEIKLYGAFVLNRRVVLHAMDATPARWRGDVSFSPLDGTSAAASAPDSLVDFHTGHPGPADGRALRRWQVEGLGRPAYRTA